MNTLLASLSSDGTDISPKSLAKASYIQNTFWEQLQRPSTCNCTAAEFIWSFKTSPRLRVFLLSGNEIVTTGHKRRTSGINKHTVGRSTQQMTIVNSTSTDRGEYETDSDTEACQQQQHTVNLSHKSKHTRTVLVSKELRTNTVAHASKR